VIADSAAHGPRPPRAPPPAAPRGVVLRRALFGSWPAAMVTGALVAALGGLAWQAVDWGLLRAVWVTGAAGPEACRVDGAGACWAVVGEKARLILFGSYPYAEQWRAGAAVAVLVALYAVSAWPGLRKGTLLTAWAAALAATAALMWGGVFGWRFVPSDQWGGLPVTLILATCGLAVGFPLALVLALLRHAPRGGIGKALAVAVIELVRAVPLLAVLFLASVMVPLFLPPAWDVPKLLRVTAAFALFTAAYLAEVVRGGLQAVPAGQLDAARALGLPRHVITLRIVLPQALAAVLPAIVNVFIAFFKATSIVVVVGIFDLMTAAKRAAADAQWQGFGTEIFLAVGAIYFVCCWAMSAYSARLQRGLDAARQR
jgi:general L-amino acid transport system permease protein